MKAEIPAARFHARLFKEVFATAPTDEDVFCIMLLLHACKLYLSEEATVEGGGRSFEGITTRHAAEVVASLFSEGDERRDPSLWYYLWNGEWEAYRVLECPPKALFCDLRRVRCAIESHPCVDRLEDDDWILLAALDRSSDDGIN